MKFEWIERNSVGQSAIVAGSGESDGFPSIESLLVDQTPRTVNDDLMAAACILAFGGYTSGAVSFPRPISPEVARSIERFLEPSWVHIDSVNFVPKANPIGSATLYLETELNSWRKHRSVFGENRRPTLCVLRSSDFAGALTSADGLITASNAFLLSALDKQNSIFPFLAVAVLFCESLNADTIVLPEAIEEDPMIAKAVELLKSCKIRLVKADAIAV